MKKGIDEKLDIYSPPPEKLLITVRKSNFMVEKTDKHHLRQVLTVNITKNVYLYSQHPS